VPITKGGSVKRKTLYHKGKGGAMYSWTIWTVGPEIHTEHGQIGGAMTPSMKVAKGKNVGRSNETSPAAQADKEAEAMYTHKLERKYSTTPDAADAPVFLPMLAYGYDKVKPAKLTFPADEQPKLNGVRCLARWEGNSVRLMSRGGKTYEVPHLSTDIAKFLPEDTVLDGEIYIHGATLQQINRLVKKFRPGPTGTASLQLWVYDLFEADNIDTAWKIRRSGIVDVFKSVKASKVKSLIQVPSKVVRTPEEVIAVQNAYIGEGYEGGILRLLEGKYELGHRSRSLLKVKSFEDGEFKIVGYKTGRGKFEGCVIWVCDAGNGETFKVVPKGTLEDKKEKYKNGESYLGQLLTVRYAELSEAGIPTGNTVGVGIRDPRDMP
jgi:DNA ligase-1